MSTNNKEESFSQIENKITNFINIIERFENDQKKIVKHDFEFFVKTCNELSKNIEESLKRELMKPGDENKNLILRYQKIMAEQKKKVKNLQMKKQDMIIEENKVEDTKLTQNNNDEESMGFLSQQSDSMEDYVKRRQEHIIKIHRDITLVSQINEEISILIQQQSESVDKIENNIDQSNDKLKQANKDLIIAGEKKGLNKERYMKLIGYLLIFIFILMFMLYYTH